jgi:RND superfamily putative drug exporter
MLSRLAPHLVRQRRLILVVGLLLVVAAGAYGGGVADRLTTGGFDDPNAESSRAADVLEATFGTREPQLVFVATAVDGSVDSPASATAGRALTDELAQQPGVAQVASYWSLGSPPPLASTGGDRALVLVQLSGDEDAQDATTEALRERFEGDADGMLTLAAGGQAAVFGDVGHTIEQDLLRAELIVLPITLFLLIIIFGSVVAASLPLLVGLVAVMGTFASLQLISSFTDVSIYALNLTTALGLGLAIDYSLFVVSRFREELAAGHSTRTAVERTVRTAGRTVLFSAGTVAISLAALLVFPLTFLRSFAYAGIAVAATAAVGAVVLLPAVLAMLGHRVNSLRLFRRQQRATDHEGRWHRIAMFVMRRPIGIATASVIVLLLLGAPFLRIAFGLPDDRVLPPGNEVRSTQDILREEFSGNEAGALEVVLSGYDTAEIAVIGETAETLSALPGVARVDALTGSYVDGTAVAAPNDSSGRFVAADATWLSVVPAVEPLSPEGEQLVDEIRSATATLVDDGVATEVLVGGGAAQLVDSKASLFDRLPWAVAIIAVTTFVLLFLLFGSVLVPLKALLLNLLSLSATFGAMVWIFQDGNLSGILGFTATGTIDTTMPILMFCIAFGLSMDYEVFLLSRIKEEHDRGSDTTTSVALGLERTGGIVTAAAILMAVVFFAFGTSGVSFLKMFGIGLGLAVLMDAFVIRALLVPSFMKLAGSANWWAPAWMRRVHDRFGISESDESDVDPTNPEHADDRNELVGVTR